MAKKERRTQRSDILRYLKTHKRGITPKIAEDLFGAQRLSGHIHVLRKRGYDIETIDMVAKTRYGTDCTYARYVLHEN